jgi:RecA/RadA recombinase
MSTIQKIRESLGHVSMKWKPRDWLDTGIPDLNQVIGHKTLGPPFGKIIEISGWESQGKTALMMALAALAQRSNARIDWLDVENSFDPDWAAQRGFLPCPACQSWSKKNNGNGGYVFDPNCKACGGEESPQRGLDSERLVLVQPYVGQFTVTDPKTKKKSLSKEARLSNAQELCSEAEAVLTTKSKFTKNILVLDSIPALLTAGEAAAGLDGSNLRTKMDLPMFMSSLLRRWVGTAQVTNTLIVLVNQLRTDPMNKFGSSDYTPGGNAPLFYSHVRVRVNRVKGGTMKQSGKVIGIQGVMRALKNKAGGTEGSSVGYRIYYNGPVEFVPVKELTLEN